jgi:hypothetical protein
LDRRVICALTDAISVTVSNASETASWKPSAPPDT